MFIFQVRVQRFALYVVICAALGGCSTQPKKITAAPPRRQESDWEKALNTFQDAETTTQRFRETINQSGQEKK
jgi:starvation-inducible outer membrane lipoprotein